VAQGTGQPGLFEEAGIRGIHHAAAFFVSCLRSRPDKIGMDKKRLGVHVRCPFSVTKEA
jgi:hypothetical protein